MKAFLRWAAKVIGSAITLVLAIILFPYMSKFAAKLLPDESGAAIKTSATLAAKLESSARLETFKVSEEGVLNYDVQAAFLGSVANINAKYLYEASFGIDLSQVSMMVSGDEIIFTLPPVEVLQDSLTPQEVYRDDFWYPGFSDADYEKLLQDERIARRDAYLSDESSQLWDASVSAFEKTISQWLQNVSPSVKFHYQPASADPN